MGSTVLRDVGETLKELFKQKIPELSGVDSIVFDSPADIGAVTTAKLALFLYQVVENIHLRNREPEAIGSDQIQYPPLTVDLLYLFVPYAPDRETELIILERLMQLLHDTSVLRGDMLYGSLKNSGEEIRVAAGQLSFEELSKLWERFPDKPFKLSVSYTLTPVRIPSERKIEVKRVKEKKIDLYTLGMEK